ncbi:hypothetical protein HII28_15815 [Planctomonas sp. JC2975]|uniref:hypothetical protein n=1 Tax=Planctomonas sp. JC2975 TaxID=2729626 RepID=UPI0014754186|nr:hypothetical protein [Planctomonas sp. JC2975]NNC13338.1 hypothetical protein [Planctomonas sp. JC2975]
MTRALRKPLWRWEPAPYVLLILLLLVTGSIRPDRLPVVYWILFAITVLVAAWLLVQVVMQLVHGPRNPDAAGMLSSLEGIELVPLAASDAPRTPVVDTARHQGALDSAQARAGRTPVAVLVPDATRWLALRIRIAVHVVASDRVYHVGFLPDQATARYNAELGALASRNLFVSAPATVMGTSQPYRLQLDLGSLAGTLDASVDAPSS